MRSFLKLTLAFFAAFVAAALALSLAAVFAAGVVLAGVEPEVPAGCILSVDLSAPVGERGGLPSPREILQDEARYPLPGHEIAAALRHAATDRRVEGVLLTGGVSGSTSALVLARKALTELRAAGKPVLAYYGSPDEKALWFGTAADELWMEPLGMVTLDGLAVEILYLGDALERHGVEVQYTRVGEYKSAVEPYVLGRMSAENREQIGAFLADLQRTLYGEIAAARGIDPARLESMAGEEGWLTAEQALAAGLVTGSVPRSELLGRLRAIAGVGAGEELPEVSLRDYARALRADEPAGRGIQVLVAEGEIVDGTDPSEIGALDLAQALRAAREDDEVAAVVLRVDSPGGSPTASDTIRSEVLALGAAGKPVVVSMGSLAASGGYWISAGAEAIVAQPETLTGSIGVYGVFPNVERLGERLGLRAEVVRTAPLAGVESPLRRRDEAQMTRLQAAAERIYARFVALVAEGRRLSEERVRALAAGRVWSGLRAHELGLVDELGDLDHAIALAREKAGLGRGAPVRFAREPESPLEELLEELLDPGAVPFARAPLAGAPAGVRATLDGLRLLAGEGSVRVRLPFDLVLR
jgi:protease-4